MTQSTPAQVEGWQAHHIGSDPLSPADFALVEEALPALEAETVLVRTRWLSLDPYLSFSMVDSGRDGAGWPITGRVIGEVMDSRASRVPVGRLVLGSGRWREWNVLPAHDLFVLPAELPWPETAYFGVLGASGLTAWVGMSLGDPQPGETVLVSAATGPVGSVCAQIALDRGAQVIGIAGGPEKCALAVERYGFSACLDHRLPDLAERLAAAAPKGINMLFENVGAPSLDPALMSMVPFGRVILCGLAAHYRSTAPIALANFRLILRQHITIRAFAWTDHAELYPAGREWLKARLASGQLKYDETITAGLDSVPQAYVAMLSGKGLGKHLIQLT